MIRLLLLALLSAPAFADDVYLNLSLGQEILDTNWQSTSPIATIELEWANDWCGCSVAYEHKSLLLHGFPFNTKPEATVDEFRIVKRLHLFSF